MDEMLERIKNALAGALAQGGNGPETLARIAITAMREPTGAMLDAACRAVEDIEADQPELEDDQHFAKGFTAAIDEALKP